MIDYADTHCHLDFDAFDSDREAVLERAREAGISRILNPGVDVSSSRAALQLAEGHPEVYAAVGVHPNSALTWEEDTLDQLAELASDHGNSTHPKVKAIGEIGLDYYRDRAPRELQRHVFQEQLKLAERMGLPVIIHNRQATADTLDILAEWHNRLHASRSPLADRPGVLHSYSDDGHTARRAISLNFYIGITGPVTFHNAAHLQSVVASLPLENLLTETDAPFLAPHPHRGMRNEPAHVCQVVEKIASLKNQPLPVVAEMTSLNARRLFVW